MKKIVMASILVMLVLILKNRGSNKHVDTDHGTGQLIFLSWLYNTHARRVVFYCKNSFMKEKGKIPQVMLSDSINNRLS